MRNQQNIGELVTLMPDYMGFIFYEKSPRNIGEAIPEAIRKLVLSEIKKTGVFVNMPADRISEKAKKSRLQAIQLHGNELPDQCYKLKRQGLEVIKAFQIGSGFDFFRTVAYAECCNYFLFDTLSTAHGGTGYKFDWNILGRYQLNIPFFLSGGIGIDDIQEIEGLDHPMLYGVDLNSKFETKPGIKDIQLLKTFFNTIRKTKNNEYCREKVGISG